MAEENLTSKETLRIARMGRTTQSVNESDTLASKWFVNNVCEPLRRLTGGGRDSWLRIAWNSDTKNE